MYSERNFDKDKINDLYPYFENYKKLKLNNCFLINLQSFEN